MFTRYRDAGQIPADSDIEAMIEEIKPWYLSGALAMSMVLPNSLAVFQAKVNADSLYLRQRCV